MLARHLRDAWPGDVQRDGGMLTPQQQERVSRALRAYEAERRQRVLPISLRSYAIGAAGQIANPLVRACCALTIGSPFTSMLRCRCAAKLDTSMLLMTGCMLRRYAGRGMW